MNALLRKEARLLLPGWMGALVAATTPLWGWKWEDGWGISMTLFAIGALGLTLSPFGQETSHGTLGQLLVQPENRRRFWRVKTGLLGMALFCAWTVFALCLWKRNPPHVDLFEPLSQITLIALVAFSGGLWSTLLLRDMVSAFFGACLAPGAICFAALACASRWLRPESKEFTAVIYWVLGVYAIAGFVWARRLFLNAQDVPWTGGQISLSSVRGMSWRWLAFEFKGRKNPWLALAQKELQLQEVTMVLIPMLIVLYLTTLMLFYFHPNWEEKELIVKSIPLIWLVTVPFVIGCVAVAEERRLNILESLLCLPMSKRATFAVKLTVALGLGIGLGGVLPWALEHASGPPVFKLRDALAIAAAITGISFYGSTLSRGLLLAIPAALGAATLSWSFVILSVKLLSSWDINFLFLQSSVFPTVALPPVIITFVWLAFRNYRRLHSGWQVWLGDFVRVGVVLGCVILANLAIFHRCWEVFMRLEPRHGPARIQDTGKVSIRTSEGRVCVVLPDGRLWLGMKDYHLQSVPGGFARGSNWIQATVASNDAVALQSNGTLWRVLDRSNIRQIGTESDWKKIDGYGLGFKALKQGGTLWKSHFTPGNDHHFIRVGNDSDWVNVFCLWDGVVIAVKQNGSLWKSDEIIGYKTNIMSEKRETFSLIARFVLFGQVETNWSSIVRFWNGTLGIGNDGSMWAFGKPFGLPIFGQNISWTPEEKWTRVGSKSDWVALSGHRQLAALEADGTLWTMQGDKTIRPSKYADWVATTEDSEFTWALARDGTLSCWDEFDLPEQRLASGPEPTFLRNFFLGPTRRPIFSSNIFDQPE